MFSVRYARVLLLVPALGCFDGRGTATIRGSEDAVGVPLATVEFIALPFDAMAVLDSLAAVAHPGPPAFPELEARMEAYTRPDPAAADAIHRRWVEARDRVRALSDSLNGLDRDGPAYARVYTRFRERYDDLVNREADLERALLELSAADVALANEAAVAADSLRAWEDRALVDFDSIINARLAASGRSEHRFPGADHEFDVRLEAGPWWLTARIPHPQNPFLEIVVNVPFTVNRLVPTVVPILGRHVTLQWRH